MSQIITAAPLTTLATHNTEIKVARRWQLEAVPRAAAARHFILIAPGGSGKSLAQCMAGAIDLERTGNKQLILVPQNHIHHGFVGDFTFQLPNDRKREWHVKHNFCEGTNKGERLKRFLFSDPSPDSVAIATHSALARLWGQLSEQEKELAIAKTTFRIDEAHHISGVFENELLDDLTNSERNELLETYTRLGDFCRFIINSPSKNTKLNLTTATFFRGDRHVILSEKVRGQFDIFELPWSAYFGSLGLEEFTFDFQHYADDPIKLITSTIKREKTRHYVVIIPGHGRRFRDDTTLDRLKKELRIIYPSSQILDLVTRQTQVENKTRLMKTPEHFHVCIACRLFDEGTDWVKCDRLHNADACEKSLPLAVQRFFRPLRYHPEKKSVKLINYIPEFSESLSHEDKRRILSDRFNAILACIVTAGEIVPCKVDVRNNDRRTRQIPLQDIYGREKYNEVLADLIEGYELIEDKSKASSVSEVVNGVIEAHGVPNGVDANDLESSLEAMVIRIAKPVSISPDSLVDVGFDVGAIARNGFDKVWEKQGNFENILTFGTEKIDHKTIRDLIDTIHRPLSLEEIHAGIRKHFETTGERVEKPTAFVPSLGVTTRSLDGMLRNHYNSTLYREVVKVLGPKLTLDIEKVQEVLKTYQKKGIRITCGTPFIPELNISGSTLNGTLISRYYITLSKLAHDTLGPIPKLGLSLDLNKIRKVIKSYYKRGIQLNRRYGHVPELDTHTATLDYHLLHLNGQSFADFVSDTIGVPKKNQPVNEKRSVADIRRVLKKYIAKGDPIVREKPRFIPELGISSDTLRVRLLRHNTTLLKENEKLGYSTRPNTSKLINAVRNYIKRGKRISGNGRIIPEFGMTGGTIDYHLRTKLKTSIALEKRKLLTK